MTDQGVLLPLADTILTFEPSLFYFQFVQLFAALLSGFLGIFGLSGAFAAL